MKPLLTRRTWLTLAGASALPWFRKPARAQNATPRKIVFFYTPHGSPAEYFYPSSGTTDSFILEPLDSLANEITVLQGIDYKDSSNHPAIHDILTNHLERSLDHVLADTLSADRVLPSLHLGVIPDYTQSFTVDGQWSYSPAPVAHDPDPVRVYDSLLAANTAPSSDEDTSAEVARLIADFDLREVERWESALSGLPGEAEKLGLHAQAVRELMARPTANPTAGCAQGCGALASVEAVRGLDVWAQENFPALLDAQLDVAAAALGRGLTRVVNLQLMYTNAQIPLPNLGIAQGHHDVSHSSVGSEGRRLHAEAQRWFATKYGELLQKLKVPDPDDPTQTLLDNTCVVWCTEVGDGQDHHCNSVPFVLGGSAGGFLQMGQHLNFGSRSHASLLLTLSRAMSAGISEFGPNSDQGPLTELEA